ncbi:MAG: 50S ribosomal protein L14e [Candidatus Bathyarchaeota archaeon]|nr:50S ribosomal protein L14e [Candidatus Bathyarchaeota archaeon]
MSSIEIGSLYIKTTGKDKGKRCIIVDLVDKNFVLVTGPPQITGVKRRRVNLKHLSPTEEKIEIKKGATDKEIEQVLTKGKSTPKKAPAEKKRKNS